MTIPTDSIEPPTDMFGQAKHPALLAAERARAERAQNRVADHQWETVQTEERQNEDIIDLSKKVLELTRSIHELTTQVASGAVPRPDTPPD